MSYRHNIPTVHTANADTFEKNKHTDRFITMTKTKIFAFKDMLFEKDKN